MTRAAHSDENAIKEYGCPACPYVLPSVAALNKHLDSECTSIIADSRPPRSKTPTPSQKTKKPKTPSRSSSKPPKKTPLAETSGNGNLNSFFSKANSNQKPPSSTFTPSASQGKRKKETRLPQPSRSAPPSTKDNEELERVLVESREMANLEAAQRQTRAEENAEMERELERERREMEAEAVAQQLRYEAQTVAMAKMFADDRRRIAEHEVKEKAAKEEAERLRQREAENQRKRLADEAEAKVKAMAKADARAAKTEAKAQAKAERARLKAEGASAVETCDSPIVSQNVIITETPVPSPSSQKRKREKSVPPSSQAASPPSQNDSGDSEAHAPPPLSQKRKRGESVQPSAQAAPPPSQNDSGSEAHAPPAASPSRKRKGKATQPPSSTATSPTHSGSDSESPAQSPSSDLSPSGSESSRRRETRILQPPSVLSPSGSQSRKRSRSTSLPPSSNPDQLLTHRDAEDGRQESPASTPTPTASQLKNAKKRAVKKNKKSTVLEKSSSHSRDGQEQSNVVNPLVAPSPVIKRRKGAGPSPLSSIQSVDSSQGQERQVSPAQRPRRGSLLTMYNGQNAPTEQHEKLHRSQIEWMEEEGHEDEDEREPAGSWTRSEQEVDYQEDDETRESCQRAELEESQRQQVAGDQRERARLEEEASNARIEQRRQGAEEGRLRDQAHAANMAAGHAQVKARKAEAKAKMNAEKMRADVERDELRHQQEEEKREREQISLVESKTRAEEEERQRRQQEQEDRLRIEAEAEAEAQAEADKIARQNEEAARRAALEAGDEYSNDHEVYNESGTYDEMYDAAEPTASQQDTLHEDPNASAFDQEGSSKPPHGYVDEQYMQIKLPGPTTMNKLQQSRSSYSTSSPYASAPWSAASQSHAPESTEPDSREHDSPTTTLDFGLAPSQDYDSLFDNTHLQGSLEIVAEPNMNDSQRSTESLEPPVVVDNSQESVESWQGIPDTPAPATFHQNSVQRVPSSNPSTQSTQATPSVSQKCTITAVRYTIPARPTITPFRPPMNPSAYQEPEAPTSSQKCRRVKQGWMPSDPVQPPNAWTTERIPFKAGRTSPQKGVLKNYGTLQLSQPDLSPGSRRTQISKLIATMRRKEIMRLEHERELDQHMAIRFKQHREYQIIEENLKRRDRTRSNLLTRCAGWTEEQAMRHLAGMPPRDREDESMQRTLRELHDFETEAVKPDKDGVVVDKDKSFLYALRESILDSNVGAASLYLVKMLKMQTEPRRICEVLCATAARCVPVNVTGGKPFSGNPNANHYASMASDVMNIVAFSDGSDELVQEQLLATTVQLAQANKTNKWKKGLAELFAALEGVDELKVPEMLKEGSEADKERKDYMEKVATEAAGYMAGDVRQLTLDEKMKAYMPSPLASFAGFMKEPLEESVEEDFGMVECVPRAP